MSRSTGASPWLIVCLVALCLCAVPRPASAQWQAECSGCAKYIGGDGMIRTTTEKECLNAVLAERLQNFPFGPCEPVGGASSTSLTAGSSTGSLMGDVLNLGANLWIAQHISNPYTAAMAQSFTQGFLTGLFTGSNAQALRQRQIAAEAVRQQQQEAAARARAEQQRRIDAMYARVNSQLKLEGLPQLTLMSEGAVGNIAVKLTGSGDAPTLKLGDDLTPRLKLGDDLTPRLKLDEPLNPTLKLGDETVPGYGIPGLPGLYVGGPANSSAAAGPTLKLGDEALPGYGIQGLPGIYVGGPVGGPAVAPEPAAGHMGIAGLPGIYLDNVDPAQAAQVAASASLADDADRSTVQDAALQAARKNPALTGASADPAVIAYQAGAQAYDEASRQQQEAWQQASEAQGHVQADQAAIEYARAQLAANPSDKLKQAFQKMLDAGQADEALAVSARENFERTDAGLSIVRTQASAALARTADDLKDAVADNAPADPALVDATPLPPKPSLDPAVDERRHVSPLDALPAPPVAAASVTPSSALVENRPAAPGVNLARLALPVPPPLPLPLSAPVEDDQETQAFVDEANRACAGSTRRNCAFMYAWEHKNDIKALSLSRRNGEHYLLTKSTCDGVPGAEWTTRVGGVSVKIPAAVTTNILALGGIPGYSMWKELSNAAGSPTYATSPPSLKEMAWAYKGLRDCLLRKP